MTKTGSLQDVIDLLKKKFPDTWESKLVDFIREVPPIDENQTN